jgi:hypothetical protein
MASRVAAAGQRELLCRPTAHQPRLAAGAGGAQAQRLLAALVAGQAFVGVVDAARRGAQQPARWTCQDDTKHRATDGRGVVR